MYIKVITIVKGTTRSHSLTNGAKHTVDLIISIHTQKPCTNAKTRTAK